MIELPLWPPTTNTLYRTVAGRMVISKRARQFYRDGLPYVKTSHPPLAGRLSLTIHLYPPDKRRRDLDNHLKGLLDLLTKCQVWEDDSQVDELTVIRKDIVPRGRVEIHICQLPGRTSPIS